MYATYRHGPVLPENPWLADHRPPAPAPAHRYRDFGPLAPLTDQAETQVHATSLRQTSTGKVDRASLGREPLRPAPPGGQPLTRANGR